MKNTGTLPVYLRIKIEKSINKPDDQLPDNWRDLISCNFNLDDPTTVEIEGAWIYLDGYYYYNITLDPDSATVPLFDTVSFSADIGNAFTNSEFNLTVHCQATQSNGNSDSVLTAWGWPAEQNTINN